MSAAASPPREGIESQSAFQVATMVTMYAQWHSLVRTLSLLFNPSRCVEELRPFVWRLEHGS